LEGAVLVAAAVDFLVVGVALGEAARPEAGNMTNILPLLPFHSHE